MRPDVHNERDDCFEPNPKSVPSSKPLSKYSIEDLKKAQNIQENYQWNFSQEREFVENLFCQRINFLLIIYAVFITAASCASSQMILFTVLSLGTVLCLLVWFPIRRAYVKLDVNFIILHNLPQHPFEFIRTEMTGWRHKPVLNVNWIIGNVVPWFCILTLAAGAICAYCGLIDVSPSQSSIQQITTNETGWSMN